LTAKERQLWNREDPNNRATPQQRMADALAELISEPTGDSRSVGTDLLVIADFDVLKQQLENPRLVDGSPIPITELHKLALEANLLPSIFDTKTQDMWLGRRVRTATEAQRIALIARDQCCIGCGANPLWCQAHHIIWWSKNGPTDLENLVLVCNDCHHKIHDDGWQVHKHPDTGKYYLKPPTDNRPAALSSEPPTHQSDERPTVSVDKPASTSSGEPSTRGSGEFPTGSVGEPLSDPSDKHPTDSTDKPLTRPNEQRPALYADKPSTRPADQRPTDPTDEPLTQQSGQRPTVPSTNRPGQFPNVPVREPPTRPADQRPTDATEKPLTQPADQPRVASKDEPLTRQSGQRPTVLSGKSARTSSDGCSISGPGQFPDVPVRELPTLPSAERPTNSADKPRVASTDEPLTRPSGQHLIVLPDESTKVSSDGSSTSRPGQFPDVPVREPPTRPSAERPTNSADEPLTQPADQPRVASNDEPLTRQSGQRPTVLSDESTKVSSDGCSISGPGQFPDVPVRELPTRPAGQRPTNSADKPRVASTDEPLTRPSGQHLIVLADESTKTSSDGCSTSGPGQFPDVPVRELPTLPSAERPTNSTDKPRVASIDEPLTRQSGQHLIVLPDESTKASSDGSSTSGPHEIPNVPVREPPTRPADQRPTQNAKRHFFLGAWAWSNEC